MIFKSSDFILTFQFFLVPFIKGKEKRMKYRISDCCCSITFIITILIYLYNNQQNPLLYIQRIAYQQNHCIYLQIQQHSQN
ncbi:unnamed protein product [Paramecium sonneborni]|uniref:Transmembrane protein n=1 Tax=Paramecium sonneborni TaxID=65129 RepID=A0A8S1LQS6_9CILI|nr:unnamed protein product [Paramecium sonneborni]